MNKTLRMLMLALSISGVCFAQENGPTNNSDKVFDLSTEIFQRRFFIDLGQSNSLEIELNDMADLVKFENMDSLLLKFLKDIDLLKDSLSDELTSKRIDYLTDTLGRTKIRIQQFSQKGSAFLVEKGQVAALKLEQDTVNFIGTIPNIARYASRKAVPTVHHYLLRFIVNNYQELANYTDGRLNKKIINLQKDVKNSSWTKNKKGMYVNKDGTVSAKQPGGHIGAGDFLVLRASVNLQNYKNYFVPSASVGLALVLQDQHNFIRDFGLFWEPNFIIGKNAQGNWKPFRNDFLTLTFGQGPVKDHNALKESEFITTFSISFLLGNNGNYFDDHTVRVGVGAFSLLGGKTKIEPILYFNNFFKGVTPGIRWEQRF